MSRKSFKACAFRGINGVPRRVNRLDNYNTLVCPRMTRTLSADTKCGGNRTSVPSPHCTWKGSVNTGSFAAERLRSVSCTKAKETVNAVKTG